MNPFTSDLVTFAEACDRLLGVHVVAADLSEKENQTIQYYIFSLVQKFPAVIW